MKRAKLNLNRAKEKNKEFVKKTKHLALLFWADLIWYSHFAIVLIAVFLFFIPESVWPNRVAFHFYYLWGVIAIQFITGLIYLPKIKKFHFVCPITALEKHLIKRHPHKHVGESCIADFCAEKLGLPKWLGTTGVLIALAMITLQYLRII